MNVLNLYNFIWGKFCSIRTHYFQNKNIIALTYLHNFSEILLFVSILTCANNIVHNICTYIHYWTNMFIGTWSITYLIVKMHRIVPLCIMYKATYTSTTRLDGLCTFNWRHKSPKYRGADNCCSLGRVNVSPFAWRLGSHIKRILKALWEC